MGLDMYLNKHRYMWTEDRKKLKISGVEGIDAKNVSTIIEEVAYWRKSNQIHQWFVFHVQEGKDDCGEYFVEKEQIQELLKTIKKVMKCKGKAKELLPTKAGFFFGGTDYDEYYWEDIENSIEMLTKVLEEWDDSGYYHYRSSW